jgi:hypothetical protein
LVFADSTGGDREMVRVDLFFRKAARRFEALVDPAAVDHVDDRESDHQL